ncbi:hypothetical protein I309_06165 [Cryptococcus deuterogattii LA55]|nr:hypothetical protein I309_06165 [Cryptococcus deuterogattii LA55]KIR37130.1 hypothetical protein I352_00442 [Cryptococcus deuterogattii MMRL2647]KIR92602.1 hypothetical protein I304_03179 [Cryptococcus deuterogattii CBS 10090]KIR97923.1 hypothetical protein L804_04381 [Cryptococcus deuterogattii 2001/935-1]
MDSNQLPLAFGKRAQYRPTKPIGNLVSPPSSNKGNNDRPGLEKLEYGPSNTRQGLKRTQSAMSMHGIDGSFQKHRGNKRLSQPSTCKVGGADRSSGVIPRLSRFDRTPTRIFLNTFCEDPWASLIAQRMVSERPQGGLNGHTDQQAS